jgi:putative hydrolase of the HAD superfamily
MSEDKPAIIFDLGGVILNLKPSYTYDAFDQIRTTPKRQGEGSLPFFLDFERGAIGETEFRTALRRLLASDVSDEVLDRAWNAMLLDLPPERLALLRRLQRDYRIFLLSNTNSIHKRAFVQILEQSGLHRDFEDSFDVTYYSHEIGMRKPDREIFQFVLERNSLNPARTVFVDDVRENVDGAASAGIIGVHLHHVTILDLNFAGYFSEKPG